jgi:recombination protein RecT
MGGIMLSSILGLELGSHLGQAYLVPYNNKGTLEAQFQIGYKGYPILLTNSLIYSHVVREGEKFHYQYGLNKDLVHVPNPDTKAKIIAAYAVIKNTNGFSDFLVMHREELDKVRNASKANDSPAWKNWESEMYRKTPMMRLCKTAPLSAEEKKRVMQDETTKRFKPDMNPDHVLDLPDETDWTGGGDYDNPPPAIKEEKETIPEQQIDEPEPEEKPKKKKDKGTYDPEAKPPDEVLQNFEDELIKKFDGDSDMVEKWLYDNTINNITFTGDIKSNKQLGFLKGKLRDEK